MIPVSVITPSIPERAAWLEECRQSVRSQTFALREHLFEIDEHYRGCAKTMNRLAERAEGDWLLPLADDDLILPGCLATLMRHQDEGDIIYSPPLVWGLDEPWWFFQAPPAIPSVALIRAELWRELGGYDEGLTHEEDRAMWTRALNMGATFVKVDEAPTWVYRIHGENKSFNKGADAVLPVAA